MSDLRDKIARALGAGLPDLDRPVFAGRQLAQPQAEAIADAVLAVLDDVRAEAWDEGMEAGQKAVILKTFTPDNPYRKAEQ